MVSAGTTKDACENNATLTTTLTLTKYRLGFYDKEMINTNLKVYNQGHIMLNSLLNW